MPATSVHFNGSVNLPDAQTVMREICTRIPAGVHRMTDGETGDRNYWIFFQLQKLAAMPEFEAVPVPDEAEADYDRIPRLRLAEGVAPADVPWPKIGYADAYVESFGTFGQLRDAGTIPAGVRLQLQYPTPLAVMSGIDPADQQRLVGPYESALFADLADALGRLPHDQVAVQWDVAVEIGLLAGGFGGAAGLDVDVVAPPLVRCIDAVPDDVPVGIHLCYGDYEHHHFVQPESLELQVRLTNALSDTARRPVDWVSFTVPQGRADDAFFAPLRELRAGPETELAFALVPYHPAEQPEGTTAEQARLIDTHLAASSAGRRDWAICTECGMGRADREDVPALLDLHRTILEAQAQPAAPA